MGQSMPGSTIDSIDSMYSPLDVSRVFGNIEQRGGSKNDQVGFCMFSPQCVNLKNGPNTRPGFDSWSKRMIRGSRSTS